MRNASQPALILALLLATLAQAQASPCAQLVALRTSDGVTLHGMLYRAQGKARASGLLLVHGFGGNFYGAYFPALAQAAAKAGYTTLALNLRDHDAGPKTSDFTDNQADIAAGVAHLHALGHKQIALLGQSMGVNRVLYYQAASGDSSVVATVLVSGPGNLFDWNVWQLGRARAQASVDEALKLRNAGRDREFMLVDLGPLGKALYTPRFLLSMRGPEAKSDPFQNLSKVSNKVLLVQGTADKLVPPDLANRLVRSAKSNLATVMYLEGGDHQFESQRETFIQRVLGWLKTTAP